MDSQLLSWLALTAAAISNGLTVWNFVQSPSKRAAEAVGTLTKRVDELEKQQSQFDTVLKNLPTKDSLHELQMSTERMNSDVRVMGETLKGVKETSNLLRDWLVKESAK